LVESKTRSENAVTQFHSTVAKKSYSFKNLKELLAKASPARSGDALAGIAAENDEERVAAQLVSPLGATLPPPTPLADVPTKAKIPTLVVAGSRFLVVWYAQGASGAPFEVDAQLFDDQLIAQTSVTTIYTDPNMLDSFTPRAAYSAGADRYLFTWTQKVESNTRDEIWVSLLEAFQGEKVVVRMFLNAPKPALEQHSPMELI